MRVLYESISTEHQKTTQASQAQGRSRGGLSTKIHISVDTLGNPVRLLITEGQASEYRQADALIKDLKGQLCIRR